MLPGPDGHAGDASLHVGSAAWLDDTLNPLECLWLILFDVLDRFKRSAIRPKNLTIQAHAAIGCGGGLREVLPDHAIAVLPCVRVNGANENVENRGNNC